MFGQRLHSEALQSGRKYYQMKKSNYEYLKEKLDEPLFTRLFHSRWAPKFSWLNYDQEDSESDEENH